MPFALNSIFVAQTNPTSESVTVKLTSVTHTADASNAVGNDFEITATIAGQEDAEVTVTSVNVAPGETQDVRAWWFVGSFDLPNGGAPVIQLSVTVRAGIFAESFNVVTQGSNAISPGVNPFSIPLEIDTGNEMSRITLHGRIDRS